MKLRTLMLSGVAFGTMIALSTLAADAAELAAVGGVAGGATGSIGGAAAGIDSGLSGTMNSQAGTIGAMGSTATRTDVGAPPLTPPSPAGEIKTPTPSASVGAQGGGNAGAAGIGVTGSTGAQAGTSGMAGGSAGLSTGAGVPIASLPDPLTTLQHAAVKSRDGASIGTIQSVQTASNGKPSAVKVSLASAVGDTKEISLKPSQLSFDQKNKIVVSSLSQGEIDSLAAAQH